MLIFYLILFVLMVWLTGLVLYFYEPGLGESWDQFSWLQVSALNFNYSTIYCSVLFFVSSSWFPVFMVISINILCAHVCTVIFFPGLGRRHVFLHCCWKWGCCGCSFSNWWSSAWLPSSYTFEFVWITAWTS